MQQFLCESQNRKSEWQTRSSKTWRKTEMFFVHLLAHINQRDRKVSERVEQPTKIIWEYIKRLAFLLLTTEWTDAKQWKTYGYWLIMHTDSGPLLIHKHPSFTFVCVFVWEIRCSQMKRMESQGHGIYFLDTTKKGGVTCKVTAWKHTWIGLQSILCGPESQTIQTLPVDHNTVSMKRFHTFLAALKIHKRLTVPYTHTESCIQSAHH